MCCAGNARNTSLGSNMAKVSIIIPVWGEYYCYLDECLKSVEAQTYKDYEVIVVENKTDLPSARNEGIRQAKGEWILPLDVDNKLAPDFLEKTVGVDDIVATFQQWFGESDHLFEPSWQLSLEDFKIGNRIDAGSLYKKEIWDKVEGYDESMTKGWEDWEFWIRALKAGYHITVVREPLFFYRKHGETLAITAVANAAEINKYVREKHYGVD